MPKISFFDTLPLGMESLNENFLILIDEKTNIKKLTLAINKQLPDGLEILSCKKILKKSDIKIPTATNYKIISNKIFDIKKLEEFKNKKEYIIQKKTKKGKIKNIEIKSQIEEINIEEKTLRLRLKGTLRPSIILKEIFNENTQNLKTIKEPFE